MTELSHEVFDKIIAYQTSPEHGHNFIGNENSLVAHCHHYNCTLHKIMHFDIESLNIDDSIIDIATRTFFKIFEELMLNNGLTDLYVLKVAKHFCLTYGYCNPDFDLDKNIISTENTHFGSGWLSKFGPSDKPVEHMLTGLFRAALMIYHQKDVQVKQTKGIELGDNITEFVFSVSNKTIDLDTVRGKKFNYFPAKKKPQNDFLDLTNDLTDVAREVMKKTFLQSKESGVIDAFNVKLALIPSQYYIESIAVFLKKVNDHFNTLKPGLDLLKEPANNCAFWTFGNIYLSPEYKVLSEILAEKLNISIDELTDLDKIGVIISIVNSFGWGWWYPLQNISDKIIIRATNHYEAYAFLQNFTNDGSLFLNKLSNHISTLLSFGSAAVLDFFFSDFDSEVKEINEDLYSKIYLENTGFNGELSTCFASDITKECEAVIAQ